VLGASGVMPGADTNCSHATQGGGGGFRGCTVGCGGMRGVVHVQLQRGLSRRRGVPEVGARVCLQPAQVLLDDSQLATVSRLAALFTPPPASPAATPASASMLARYCACSSGGRRWGRGLRAAPGVRQSPSAGRHSRHRAASSQNLQSKPLLATRLIEDWVPTGPRPGAGAASGGPADDVAAARLAGLDAR